MLRAKDYSEVVKVGQIVLGCNDVDELRAEVLKLMQDIFRVERAVYLIARGDDRSPRLELDHAAYCGFEERYWTLYREHYYKTDPSSQAIRSSKVAVPLRDIASGKKWIESEHYRCFVKPQFMGDSLGINIRAGNRLLGAVFLMRSIGEHDFSSDEVLKADLVAPYLAGGMERAIFSAKVDNTEQIIRAICHDSSYRGIMVLDEFLTPIYVDEEAQKILSQSVGDPEHSEDPCATLPKDLYLQCQKLFQNTANTIELLNKQRVDLIVKGEKQSVPVNVSLVHGSKNSRLCLICIGRDEPASMSPGQAKKLGLTHRESEIIGLVCQGLKNSEIGERLFISNYTVENHVKSLREKFAVKNRTSLAYKIVELSKRS